MRYIYGRTAGKIFTVAGLSLGLFLTLIYLIPAFAWAKGDAVIRGGQGVGIVRLGSDLNTITRQLGQPDSTQASPNDPNTKMMYYKKWGLGVMMGSSGRTIGITVTYGGWRTPEGIGLGSSMQQVKSAYGQGLQRGQNNINYSNKGLAFSGRNGKVSAIYVFKCEDERALLGDRLIVPGKRCGDIRIGMPVAKVTAAWGQADQASPLDAKKTRWLYNWKEEFISLIVDKTGTTVQGIVFETGDFITKEGLKVGSSRQEVVRVLGQGSQEGDLLIYEAKGISLRIVNGRVAQITILPVGR